ncbi:hypothetical protein XENOCAPTIV_021863, partial [Xenoophorus captivus]
PPPYLLVELEVLLLEETTSTFGGILKPKAVSQMFFKSLTCDNRCIHLWVTLVIC